MLSANERRDAVNSEGLNSPIDIRSEVLDAVEFERSQYAQKVGVNGHHDPAELNIFKMDGLITPPSLPIDCWPGVFQEYLSIVENTTEAPDSYHLMSFALVIGATLRKRLSVWHARDIYPNFYIVLIGPTGAARKDTAFSRARKMLEALHKEEMDAEDPKLEIIPGIGSTEGLLTALNGTGKTVILNESEFLSLISKAKQDKVST